MLGGNASRGSMSHERNGAEQALIRRSGRSRRRMTKLVFSVGYKPTVGAGQQLLGSRETTKL
jgi:hypothetical protein